MHGQITIQAFAGGGAGGCRLAFPPSDTIQLVPVFAATTSTQDTLARDREREMDRLLKSGQDPEGLSGMDGQTGYFLLFFLMIIGAIVILRRTIDA
jgi:hypothetical protein